MEKMAEFFGHFDYRFILDGINYKGNIFDEPAFSKGELIDLYSRIVNVFSHQGSFFAPQEMNEDNKDSLTTLFNHIKNKYRFILPDLNDERSEKEIRDNFDNCCAKNLFTLMDNALYRCPYAGNCYSLGLPETSSKDCVIINERSTLKNELCEFIHRIQAPPVCTWCPGRRFDDPEIEPAVQLRQPLIPPWQTK